MTTLYSPGNRFIDPSKVLIGAGLKNGMTVADFGSGNGFYSVAAAEIVGNNGKVHAVDIKEEPLRHTLAEARRRNLRNINTLRCDLEKEDYCPIQPVSSDLVILANILHHVKNKDSVASACYKALKTGGTVLIVDWEPTGSVFGPPVEMRVSEKEVADLFTKYGFKPGRKIPADPYHYAVTYIK